MLVFSNLAISLDGKIAQSDTPARALGTAADRKGMNKLRSICDVVLTGSSTLKAHSKTYRVGSAKRGARHPANAILSASGELDSNWKFWSDPEVVRFVFTTEKGAARAREAVRERAFVVVSGKDTIDLTVVLARLKKSGLQRVLVEGGGETLASFVAANLLQEMHVTLTPWLLGGRKNPTLVGGAETLMPWRKLKLLRSRKVKDEIFLHYKVVGAKRV